MPPAPRMTFKITILGDGGVGKTALTVQFTMSSFIEVNSSRRSYCRKEYTALRDQWIRDGEGFIVVYAITSRSTFARVERIVERILRVKEESPTTSFDPYDRPSPSGPSRKRIPIVIVGNKRDKYHEREVSTEEAKMLAIQLGCDFYETSAKKNDNVEAAFKSLVRQIQGSKKAEGLGNEPYGGGGIRGGKSRKKKRCVIL